MLVYKKGVRLSTLGLCVGFILGLLSGLYLLHLSRTTLSSLKIKDVADTLKTAYIQGVEVEALVTHIEGNKTKYLVTLKDDATKFWVVAREDFGTAKEDMSTVFLVLDENRENILKGETFLLDNIFYNAPEDLNKDSLHELSYKEYKQLENTYISNYANSKKLHVCKTLIYFSAFVVLISGVLRSKSSYDLILGCPTNRATNKAN